MIDKDIEGRALFKFKDEVLVQVPYIDDQMVGSIMSAYQKPQSAQAEVVNKVTKSPKNIIKKDEDKKIMDIEHLLPEQSSGHQPQHAKLRLVQPLGVSTEVIKKPRG